jgi:hypothetical protein
MSKFDKQSASIPFWAYGVGILGIIVLIGLFSGEGEFAKIDSEEEALSCIKGTAFSTRGL